MLTGLGTSDSGDGFSQSPSSTTDPLSHLLHEWQKRYGFTPAEMEILHVAIREETCIALIAQRRGTTVGTVKKQAMQLADKRGVRGLREATIRFLRELLSIAPRRETNDETP